MRGTKIIFALRYWKPLLHYCCLSTKTTELTLPYDLTHNCRENRLIHVSAKVIRIRWRHKSELGFELGLLFPLLMTISMCMFQVYRDQPQFTISRNHSTSPCPFWYISYLIFTMIENRVADSLQDFLSISISLIFWNASFIPFL